MHSRKMRLVGVLFVLAALAALAAVACTKEVVKEVEVPGETIIVEKEVVKEVEVEVIVEKEVVKEVEVEVIVEKEVVKTVEVPGETIVEKEVVKTVEVPGETIIVEKEVVKTVEVEKIVTVFATPAPTAMEKVGFPVAGSKLTFVSANVGPRLYHRPASQFPNVYYAEGLNIQECLIGWNGVDYTPLLAETWAFEIFEGAEGITFNLKRGVPWHNTDYGTLDGNDVHWIYTEANREGTIAHHSQFWFRDFENQRLIDSHTLRWDWARGPTLLWSKLVAHQGQCQPIASEDQYVDRGEDYVQSNPIGTGPYKLISHAANDLIILEAVQNHWRQSAGFETVHMLEVPEQTTRIAMLLSGQADMTHLQVSNFDDVAGEPDIRLVNGRHDAKTGMLYSYGGNFLLTEDEAGVAGPDTDFPWFPLRDELPWVGDPDDPVASENAQKVRVAMSYAIDRELINESFLDGKGCVDFIYGPDTCNPRFKEEWGHPYDPEMAKQMLADAGYPDGFEFTYVTMGASFGELFDDIALSLVGFWDAIGLTAEVDSSPYQVHRPGLLADRTWFDINVHGFYGDTRRAYLYMDVIPDATFGRVTSNLGYDFPEAASQADRLAVSFDEELAWEGPLNEWHTLMSHQGYLFTVGTVSWENSWAAGPGVGEIDMITDGGANHPDLEGVWPVIQ